MSKLIGGADRDDTMIKVKASHTCYRALDPELIPMYMQSARRRL